MKKYLLLFILFIMCVFAFAQTFDDLPYANPDMTTYFQQEISSLLLFQSEKDLNIPFFASLSMRGISLTYDPEYIHPFLNDFKYIHSSGKGYDIYDDFLFPRSNAEINLLLGSNFRINSHFYLPLFFSFGYRASVDFFDELEFEYEGETIKEPADMNHDLGEFFFGSGLFINYDKVKLGIFAGLYTFFENSSGRFPSHSSGTYDFISNSSPLSFKIQLVPLLNTSEWAFIGKKLNSILGYIGMGDTIHTFEPEKKDSTASAFVDTINMGLDFMFNRIDFGAITLDVQAIYLRGNFDAAAKADSYGLKVQGLLSGFPFGFSLDAGYKHFFDIAKYFKSDYNDTVFINASIFFPFKNITFGFIYNYDNIYMSRFTAALSTNFLSGLYTITPAPFASNKNFLNDSRINQTFGMRYRHGGWRVK